MQARNKVPNDALDISQMVKVTTDAIALIGTANFGLNMRRRERIKPELNEDYKNLCSSLVPFTDSLFGNDSDLSIQLKGLAEATKVSRKISRRDSKGDARKTHGNKSYKNTKGKGFGYKHSQEQHTHCNKHLNVEKPSFHYQRTRQRGGGRNRARMSVK